jgi:Rhs element Vgr protein
MTLPTPLGPNTDLVTMTVLANGSPLPDTYQVQQIRTHKQVNRIASARLVLYDGDASGEAFAISSGSTLVPGTKITIKAGYHNGTETTLFDGIVIKHAIQVRSNHKSYLTLTCFDKALALTIGRKSGYVGTTDSAVFSQIIGGAGLTAQVDSTTAASSPMVRYYATDWDFLVSRAEINGMIVLVDDGVVAVQKPKASASPVLLVEYGQGLNEVNAEIDASLQLASVSATSWDCSTQATLAGQSSEPDVNEQGNLSGSDLASVLGLPAYELQSNAPATGDELAGWASAQLLKSRLAKVRGKVTFRGNALPKIGGIIQLAGVGDRFNGNAFVSSVVHQIEDGNWSTEVGFGLSPQWFVNEVSDVESPPASGLLPSTGGLLIGTVKQIDSDPAGQDRILVEVPVIASSGDGIWARMASPYATSNAGIMFVPEVGDEVVLGFLNNDPRAPVVLGSLYSSQHTPAYAPDAPNTNKVIVTKNQLKITMDDVKKIVVVSTPGGHVLTMSDDAKSVTLVDSNGNKMNMESGGITFNSCADITMTATGNIALNANGGAVNIKGSAEITASAPSISASASASLSLQGDLSSKLASSGETTIQGTMVMIN